MQYNKEAVANVDHTDCTSLFLFGERITDIWRIFMSITIILEQAGIPLLLFALCVYYGMRLLILQDISAIRGKDQPPVRDEKAYAREGGKLMLFFAVATLVMAALMFVNVYVAVGQIIVCTIILGILWKRMNDRYGA